MSAKTFGQRADDYASNTNDQPWFEAREAHLSELLTAFWFGEFEDENGDTQLSIKIASNYQAKSDPATRKLVLRVLPISAPWMPEEIRRWNDQGPRPYHTLAAMRARQYDPEYLFNLLEKISIADDTYRSWLRSHQISPQAQDQPGQPSEQKTKHQPMVTWRPKRLGRPTRSAGRWGLSGAT